MELLLRLDGLSPSLHFCGKTHVLPPWQLPLSRQDIEEIRWYLEDYPRYAASSQKTGADQVCARFKEFGEALFEVVVTPVLDIWQSALTLPEPPILIIESQDANWLSLPFELLRNPKTGTWIIDQLAGIVRRAEFQESAPALNSEEGVRLLVIAPRPYRPDVPLQVTTSRLARVLKNRRIELRIVRPPKYSEMKRLLEKAHSDGKPWQVVLFDGHGAIKTMKGKKSHNLIFNQHDTHGEAFWHAERFAKLIAATGVQLVLLNACRSAKAVSQGEDTPHPTGAQDEESNVIGSYALELSRIAKIPVVAMSHKILVETASRFTVALLEAWLNGAALLSAIREARTSLRQDPMRTTDSGPISLDDWIVPTLYGDGALRLTSPLPTLDTEKGDTVELIGRDDEFRELEEAFVATHMALVFGSIGIGKSALGQSFADWWKFSGGIYGQPKVCELVINTIEDLKGLEENFQEIRQNEPAHPEYEVFLLVELSPTIIAWPEAHRTRFVNLLRDFSCSSPRSKVLFLSRNPLRWTVDEKVSITRISLHGLGGTGRFHYDGIDRLMGISCINRQEREYLRQINNLLRGEPWLLQIARNALAKQTLEVVLTRLEIDMAWLLGSSTYNGLTVEQIISDALNDLSDQDIAVIRIFAFFFDRTVLSVVAAVMPKIGMSEAWNVLNQRDWKQLLDKLFDSGVSTFYTSEFFGFTPVLPRWLECFWRSNNTERNNIDEIQKIIYSGILELIYESGTQSVRQNARIQAETYQPSSQDKLLNPYLRNHISSEDYSGIAGEDEVQSTLVILWYGVISRALEYLLKKNDFKAINEGIFYVLRSWVERGWLECAERWQNRIEKAALVASDQGNKDAEITLDHLSRARGTKLIAEGNLLGSDFLSIVEHEIAELESNAENNGSLYLANKYLGYGEFSISSSKNIEKGILYIRRARQIFSTFGRSGDIAICWATEALYFVQQQEIEQSKKALAQAELFLSMDSDTLTQFIFHEAGYNIAALENNLSEMGSHEEKLRLASYKMGGVFSIVALFNRAALLNDQGCFEEALQLIENGLGGYDLIHNHHSILTALLWVRATAAMNIGQYRLATQWFVEAEEKAKQQKDIKIIAYSMIGRASILQKQGDTEEVNKLIACACQVVKDQPPSVRFRTHTQCSEILIEQSKLQLAEELLVEVSELIKQFSPSDQHTWYRLGARIAWLREDYVAMLNYLEPAIEISLPIEMENEKKTNFEGFCCALAMSLDKLEPEILQKHFDNILSIQKVDLISCVQLMDFAKNFHDIGNTHASNRFIGMAKTKLDELSRSEQEEAQEIIECVELADGSVDIELGEREMREKRFSPLFNRALEPENAM